MPAWGATAVLVALALAVAAALAEQACRLRGLPTRGCWLAAMGLSVLLPLAAPLLPPLLPATTAATDVPLPALAQPATSRAIPARVDGSIGGVVDRFAGHVVGWLQWTARAASTPAYLPWMPAALSLAMLACLSLASLRLHRRARAWRRTRIDGLDVYVAPQAGPAVFGWWQPCIVLPEWLGHQPSRQRSLALAHESAHLQARDPQLLAAGLLLLAAMPWNLPLWWQLGGCAARSRSTATGGCCVPAATSWTTARRSSNWASSVACSAA